MVLFHFPVMMVRCLDDLEYRVSVHYSCYYFLHEKKQKMMVEVYVCLKEDGLNGLVFDEEEKKKKKKEMRMMMKKKENHYHNSLKMLLVLVLVGYHLLFYLSYFVLFYLSYFVRQHQIW
eukprot:CAMPEP_0114401052 /NCGR_PEP_ID=MMETSP0102-20121206/16922_1 /TAXON_ID=38822 ORGANISM="Pteridomonas danica, Strain PT" /NCGR_SAMPLE_ID=MMETSP0102 /ASSEMBLY_ACC=CAM_ASM_000212 /LENGTH=118 /DNA_ID=CAMNT_0001563865 /DNA_START=255 /DNA_END=608 /DNA_ORIENTATION=+